MRNPMIFLCAKLSFFLCSYRRSLEKAAISSATALILLGCSYSYSERPEHLITSTATKNLVSIYTQAYEPYPRYVGEGKVKNISKLTFNDYSMDVKFILYDANKKSFVLKNSFTISVDDGFGIGKRKEPWLPNEEKVYKVQKYIGETNILYPIANAHVILVLKASDPFGNSIEEELGPYDLTESWLAIQAKVKKWK